MRGPGEGRTGLLRGHVLHEAVIAQHVEQRGLASIVEAEEDNLAALVVQACATSGQTTSHRVSHAPSEESAPQNQSVIQFMLCDEKSGQDQQIKHPRRQPDRLRPNKFTGAETVRSSSTVRSECTPKEAMVVAEGLLDRERGGAAQRRRHFGLHLRISELGSLIYCRVPSSSAHNGTNFISPSSIRAFLDGMLTSVGEHAETVSRRHPEHAHGGHLPTELFLAGG